MRAPKKGRKNTSIEQLKKKKEEKKWRRHRSSSTDGQVAPARNTIKHMHVCMYAHMHMYKKEEEEEEDDDEDEEGEKRGLYVCERERILSFVKKEKKRKRCCSSSFLPGAPSSTSKKPFLNLPLLYKKRASERARARERGRGGEKKKSGLFTN